MSVIVVGSGSKAGAWRMRGEQVARALGAPVYAQDARYPKDLPRAPAGGVALVIKRAPLATFLALRRLGWRVVWDPVDFWPQPDTFSTMAEAAQFAVRSIIERAPDAVVLSGRAMYEDIVPRMPSHSAVKFSIVPHHHDERLRGRVRTGFHALGYCGRLSYIDAWRHHIAAWCARRRIRFVMTPDVESFDVDVVIAPRVGVWQSQVNRRWKSNVKQANAFALGCPFVSTRQCTYEEFDTGGLCLMADSLQEFLDHLDVLYVMARDAPEDFAAVSRAMQVCASKFSLRALLPLYENVIEAARHAVT
jgi:hypothetical protein